LLPFFEVSLNSVGALVAYDVHVVGHRAGTFVRRKSVSHAIAIVSAATRVTQIAQKAALQLGWDQGDWGEHEFSQDVRQGIWGERSRVDAKVGSCKYF
jgi:hypothetical protein